MMQMKLFRLIIPFLILLVIVISGCVDQNLPAGQIVKNIKEVKEFLDQYPNAEVVVVYLDNETIEGIISDIRDECGEQMKVINYWRATVKDPESNITIKVWIDGDTNKVICLIKTGGEITTTTVEKVTTTSITSSTPTTTTQPPQEGTEPYIYDVFSGDTLNNDKWLETNETTYFKHQHLDEHYLDITNHNYHTKHNAEVDKGTFLIMKHSFYPGDTLEYDVDYVNGSGNRVSRIVINDRPLDDIVRHVPCIGYWNGDCASNTFGNHHVKVVFHENSVDVYITKPDGSMFSQNVGNFSSPYTFGINSRTGHNGLLHFDYDDFIVNEQSPITTTTIKKEPIANNGICEEGEPPCYPSERPKFDTGSSCASTGSEVNDDCSKFKCDDGNKMTAEWFDYENQKCVHQEYTIEIIKEDLKNRYDYELCGDNSCQGYEEYLCPQDCT